MLVPSVSVLRIEFDPPSELVEAVAESARTHDLVILGSHGVVTVADTYAHAIQKAEFFELTCYVIITNECKGATIPPTQAEQLRKLGQEANMPS